MDTIPDEVPPVVETWPDIPEEMTSLSTEEVLWRIRLTENDIKFMGDNLVLDALSAEYDSRVKAMTYLTISMFATLHVWSNLLLSRLQRGQVRRCDKFAHGFGEVIAMPIMLEAVMRVRATKGLRMASFHGNFFVRSTDLLAMPTTAVLRSTCTGERRIRVVTLALQTTTNLSEVYTSADQVAIATLLANKAVERSLSHKLQGAHDAVERSTTPWNPWVFKVGVTNVHLFGGSTHLGNGVGFHATQAGVREIRGKHEDDVAELNTAGRDGSTEGEMMSAEEVREVVKED
ncbi:hypothetical protein DFH11DRAFT_1547568 [Phellopilus nigrolimitatus]|nr:hypothetical protein DFH11DRAFT_1547568 [Phellopilus nigrolimitatus]